MNDSRQADSSEEEVPDEFRDALEASIAPVLELLKNARAEVARIETELRQARDRVKRAERVLFALDPSKKPTKSPKTSESIRKDGSYAVADATVDQIEKWIRELHGTEETFSTVSLEEREDAPKSGATINAALRVLRDRGVITLDSRGQGGRKNYRLTESV
jgi:DNA-binding transcriptional ArsR family regulator